MHGGELYKHLRRKDRRYRKRGSSKDSRGIIKDRGGIENRSEIVEKKLRFGDLEFNTIVGKNHKGALFHRQRQDNHDILDCKTLRKGQRSTV